MRAKRRSQTNSAARGLELGEESESGRELLRRPRFLVARADLYSAGVIFHEMLTGRAPGPKFGLPNQLSPELPQEIDAAVLKCLARRPEERYASAGELLAEIERLEEVLRLRVLTEIRGISHAGSRLLGGTGAEGAGKKTLLYVGIVVAVIVLAVVGFLVLR